MPVTLGERLNNCLTQLDQKQSAVATDWLERYKKQNSKARWEAETIISHLNRCLKDKREGVRFFFEHDALRTDLLFELLRVPQAEHPELRQLARQSLKEGEVNCRLVIDATTWGASREKAEPLFDVLKTLVLQPAEKQNLTPVALVFTEEQYDFLPRSYDRLGEWLVREEVKDADEAWQRIAKLAGDWAVVVSSRQFLPMERWLAMADSGKNLSLEPAEGLDLVAKQGQLPAPPTELENDLSKILKPDPKSSPRIPTISTERRRMMMALGDEAKSAALKMSPADRLTLAQVLKVPATSTERERLEHELSTLAAQVGAEAKLVKQAELDQTLARAKRRDVGFLLLRVGDALHAVNPPAKCTLPKSPRLTIHRLKSSRPAINRLMAEIDKWTADDYAADRGLMRVIQRLDPKGEERLAFLHARACLLWSNGLCPPTAPTPLSDWKAGLSKLLAGEPPPAQLRLFVDATARVLNEALGHQMKPYLVLKQELEEEWPSFVPDAIRTLSDPAATLLQIVPLQQPTVLARLQSLHLLDSYEGRATDQWGRTRTVPAAAYYHPKERDEYPDRYSRTNQDIQEFFRQLPGLPKILLPHSWKLVREQDLWLDLFDCSSAINGATPDPTSWAKVGAEMKAERLIPIQQVQLYKEAVEFPKNIWTDADQELALCWLALKNALVQNNAVRLHDGTVLLSMGAGLFARISIRACGTVQESSPEEQQVRGCLDARVRHGTRKLQNYEEQGFWAVRLDRSNVISHRAATTGYGNITATTTLGYDLPELFLAGHGLRAEITFLTSPLFLSYGGTTPPVAVLASAGTQALVAAKSEDQRQADEAAYDDDDD